MELRVGAQRRLELQYLLRDPLGYLERERPGVVQAIDVERRASVLLEIG